MKTTIRCECGVESVVETKTASPGTLAALRTELASAKKDRQILTEYLMMIGGVARGGPVDELLYQQNLTYRAVVDLRNRQPDVSVGSPQTAEFGPGTAPVDSSTEGILARVPKWLGAKIEDGKVIVRSEVGTIREAWIENTTLALMKVDLEMSEVSELADGSIFGIVREQVPF